MEEQYNTQHMKRTVEHPYRKNNRNGNAQGQLEDGYDYDQGHRQNGKGKRYKRIKNRTTYYGDQYQRWKVVYFIESLAPIIVAVFFLILLLIYVYNELQRRFSRP